MHMSGSEMTAVGRTPTTKVSVGPTTVAGWSTSTALFFLAALAFLKGDRSEQTLGTIAAGGAAVAIFVVTQIGRYWQAKELAKFPAVAVTNIGELSSNDGSVGPRATVISGSGEVYTTGMATHPYKDGDTTILGQVDTKAEFAEDEPGDDLPPEVDGIPLTRLGGDDEGAHDEGDGQAQGGGVQ